MTDPDALNVSRRRLLAGASAAAALSVFGAAPAFAKAPLLNSQAPAFYRFRIGAFEATVVSDGMLDVGEPSPGLFKGITKENISKALADNFLPADQLALDENALVVNTDDKLVLFDTGTGNTTMFGKRAGRLPDNLKAAGIDPKDIDVIALSHAHPDHCWGLQTEDGTPYFPNAQIYMDEADFDFWTDESKASGDLKPFIEGTRKQLLPLRERIVFFKDGQQFVPGVQAISAPGHTVGHTIFMITSEGQSLCNAADLAHHYVISVEKPRVEFGFDTDPRQGANTRLRMFGMLAAQRIPLLAYHFPWPGIGHLAKQGEGFRYIATPMQTVL